MKGMPPWRGGGDERGLVASFKAGNFDPLPGGESSVSAVADRCPGKQGEHAWKNLCNAATFRRA